jgi:hypothetical protein
MYPPSVIGLSLLSQSYDSRVLGFNNPNLPRSADTCMREGPFGSGDVSGWVEGAVRGADAGHRGSRSLAR